MTKHFREQAFSICLVHKKKLWFAFENKLLSPSCEVIKKHHVDLKLVGWFNKV